MQSMNLYLLHLLQHILDHEHLLLAWSMDQKLLRFVTVLKKKLKKTFIWISTKIISFQSLSKDKFFFVVFLWGGGRRELWRVQVENRGKPDQNESSIYLFFDNYVMCRGKIVLKMQSSCNLMLKFSVLWDVTGKCNFFRGIFANI